MHVSAKTLPLFHPGENLTDYVEQHLQGLKEQDTVIVTSKIIALSENRTIPHPSAETKKALAIQESDENVATPWCLLTRKRQDWCANAGIDESNAQGNLILLPKNPVKSAEHLQQFLKETFGLKQLGVIISDTRLVPLRIGTLGIALAWAGIEPVADYRGTKDLYGRELKMTQANIVHALATSAVLCMGEGAEQKPLAIIRHAPVCFNEVSGGISEISVLPQDDLYAYLYAAHPIRSPRPQAPGTSSASGS